MTVWLLGSSGDGGGMAATVVDVVMTALRHFRVITKAPGGPLVISGSLLCSEGDLKVNILLNFPALLCQAYFFLSAMFCSIRRRFLL